jgi:hypothetical protein
LPLLLFSRTRHCTLYHPSPVSSPIMFGDIISGRAITNSPTMLSLRHGGLPRRATTKQINHRNTTVFQTFRRWRMSEHPRSLPPSPGSPLIPTCGALRGLLCVHCLSMVSRTTWYDLDRWTLETKAGTIWQGAGMSKLKQYRYGRDTIPDPPSAAAPLAPSHQCREQLRFNLYYKCSDVSMS